MQSSQHLKFFFAFSLCVLIQHSFGQIILGPDAEKLIKSPFEIVDKGWVDRGSISLNSTQTYLSNWSAGGNSAINISGMGTYSLFYRDDRHSWDNIFNFAYGRSLIDIKEPSIKTDDKIDLTSKYGRLAKYNWSYTAMVNFKTQFAPGYVAGSKGLPDLARGKISDWLSPAYFTAALGMDYLEQRKITCFVSPFTCKGTIVKNQRLANLGQFGVTPATYDNEGEIITPGKNIRIEYGAYLRMGFSKSWKEQYRLDSKLELFSSYLNQPQNIDVNFEGVLGCKINKYLGFSLIMQMLYDDDIILVKTPAGFDSQGNPTAEIKGPGVQLREVLAIGFQYSL
ncbi:MAG: hypothetical protein RL106_1470 [Bacteroidota bacterium]|jgi:hypothetical protein